MNGIKQELNIGDPVGGGVYVGKSATTGKDLYAAASDEPEYLTLDQAFKAAAEMRKLPGRENAHVPTPEELNGNLYRNKDKGALKGTFNISGSSPVGCFRSAAPDGSGDAWVQWFGRSGINYYGDKFIQLPLRLVW